MHVRSELTAAASPVSKVSVSDSTIVRPVIEHPLGQSARASVRPSEIVLSRSRDEYPPDVSAVLSKDYKEEQVSLANLSSEGREVIVPANGHHIQLDAPDAVTSAIQAIVKNIHPIQSISSFTFSACSKRTAQMPK